MTKQEIIDYFKDINVMYNNPNMLDSLSNMMDELLKESEKCKTWGGFIDIKWEDDEKAVGYQAVFNKLIELGLLKVARTQGIEYTRYDWAIKAVKWNDEG